jgi:hypothetical protein
MRSKTPVFCLSLVLFASLPRAVRAQPAAALVEPDWPGLLGPIPQPGSRESQDELAVLRWLQRTRTRAEVDRARSEASLEPAAFAPAIQRPFDPGSHPRTLALLARARTDLGRVTSSLKKRYGRRRPFLDNPDLRPAVFREPSASFPSGHASLGALWADLLGELDPADREAIRERGAQIGTDRVLAGVHWPSDVEAGQRLGQAFASWWLAQPDHARSLQEARDAEWR